MFKEIQYCEYTEHNVLVKDAVLAGKYTEHNVLVKDAVLAILVTH